MNFFPNDFSPFSSEKLQITWLSYFVSFYFFWTKIAKSSNFFSEKEKEKTIFTLWNGKNVLINSMPSTSNKINSLIEVHYSRFLENDALHYRCLILLRRTWQTMHKMIWENETTALQLPVAAVAETKRRCNKTHLITIIILPLLREKLW